MYYRISCEKTDFFDIAFNRNINVSCPLHIHPPAEIVFVLSGELTLTKAHTSIPVRAGEMSFVMPYETHGYSTETASDMVVLIFPPELISEHSALLTGNEFAKPTAPIDTITESFINDQLPKSDTDIYSRKAFVYHTLSRFLENSGLTPAHSGEHDLLLTAIKFVAAHYTEDITLRDAARHCGVTAEHLCRIISQNTAMTFLELLSSMRMQKSQFMLRDTKYPISYVAFESGFRSIRNFNRIFKRFFGITPKEFRSSHALPQ